MSRFLVVGGSGFLGRNLLRLLGSRAVGTYSSTQFAGGLQFDVRRQEFSDLAAQIPELRWVILSHGACNVDYCASQSDASYELNVRRTIRLIEEICRARLFPIYMSSDYVFDGSHGMRREDEEVCPTTAYGRQKAEVERWLRNSGMPHLICRASKLVSGDLGTHSVLGQWAADIKESRAIRCATDQIFSPALVGDVARTIVRLAEAGKTGTFHVAGPEALSRFELAKMFVDSVRVASPDIRIQFEACKLADIKFAEPRPLNTSLSIEKLKSEVPIDYMRMAQACESIAWTHFSTH